jgi:hypothetical protein
MSYKIEDLESVGVRDAVSPTEGIEFHIEARFKDGQKFAIAVFDDSCEELCSQVCELINREISSHA